MSVKKMERTYVKSNGKQIIADTELKILKTKGQNFTPKKHLTHPAKNVYQKSDRKKNVNVGIQHLSNLEEVIIQRDWFDKAEAVFKRGKRFRVTSINNIRLFTAFKETGGSAFCWNNKSRDFRIFDHLGQEVMTIDRVRRLTLRKIWPSHLEDATVYSPPNTILGYIKQQANILPVFHLLDADDNKLIVIRGNFLSAFDLGDAVFKIHCEVGERELIGLISKNVVSSKPPIVKSVGIKFTKKIGRDIKAMLMAVCFLINDIYYQSVFSRYKCLYML